MNIVFKCEYCRAEMQASKDAIGKQCVCVGCGLRTTIGTPDVKATPSPKASSKQQVLSIDCPKCSQSLDYARALIGTKGLCRKCHSLILLPIEGKQPVILRRPASHIAFECPTCLQLFEGTQAQSGHKGRCTNCQAVFIIEPLEPKEVAPAPSKPASPALPAKPKPSTAPAPAAAELDLAPEPQKTPAPKRPTPTLRPQPATINKPKPTAPSTPAAESPAGFPQIDTPWPDFANLGSITSSATVADAYASPDSTYSPFSSSRVSLTKLISQTLDCLFPAAFILGLPALFGALANLASFGAVYGIGYIAAQFSRDQWQIRMPLGILAIIIYYGTPVFCFFAFFPIPFRLANIAAKGKPVDTSMLSISMSKRLSIVGYAIIQAFLLAPLSMVAVIPFAMCIAMGRPSQIGAALMILGCGAFLAYVSLVIYSMFSVGACAIADNRPFSRAISLSFRSLFAHPLVLLPICAIELIPLAILMVTGIGFMFVGGPYIQIRSAKLYHLMNS